MCYKSNIYLSLNSVTWCKILMWFRQRFVIEIIEYNLYYFNSFSNFLNEMVSVNEKGKWIDRITLSLFTAHVESELLMGYDMYLPRDVVVMSVRIAIYWPFCSQCH